MKKYITLIYEYSNDSELSKIRAYSQSESCRAWSMDHEILRLDLIENALDKGNIELAQEYISSADIQKYRHGLEVD